jgi:hypothetical protein
MMPSLVGPDGIFDAPTVAELFRRMLAEYDQARRAPAL